jgi:hypothetical protein
MAGDEVLIINSSTPTVDDGTADGGEVCPDVQIIENSRCGRGTNFQNKIYRASS